MSDARSVARREHVATVRRGAAAVAAWRSRHPGEQLLLAGANFDGLKLPRVDLSGADLTNARMHGAVLHGADLTHADLSGSYLGWASLHSAKLMGAKLDTAIFDGADLTDADMTGATMDRAFFQGATLDGSVLADAHLAWAHLNGASMLKADLAGATVESTTLEHAKLAGANLRLARFFGASLDNANLERADLRGTVFRDTSLRATRFTAALLNSIFSNVDLSQVVDLETASHIGPSTVGVDTALLTLSKLSGADADRFVGFLQAAGVPAQVAEYIPDLARGLTPFQLQAVFISYAASDTEFAEKLAKDLRREGAPVFFFPHDAPGGQRVQVVLSDRIAWMDRLLVLCSRESLKRGGVRNEIDQAIEKERRDGRNDVLFPLILDDVLESPDDPYALLLRGRTWRDFRDWKKTNGTYPWVFRRLVADLATAKSTQEPLGDDGRSRAWTTT